MTHTSGICCWPKFAFCEAARPLSEFRSKRNFVLDAVFVARRPNGATREIAMKKGFLISVSVFALVASAGVSAAQEKGAPSGSGQAPAAQQSPAGPQPSQQPAQEDLRGNRAQGAPNKDNQTQQEQRQQPGKNQAQDRQQPKQQTQDRQRGDIFLPRPERFSSAKRSNTPQRHSRDSAVLQGLKRCASELAQNH